MPEMPNIQELTPDLFDDTARKWAETLAGPKKELLNKPTQLRRFYDELVMWNERVAQSDDALQKALPFIYMMNSKIAYAKGRKLVDEQFQNLMKNVIKQINSTETLKHAKLFMESMMGFYKQYELKDEQQ